MFKKKIKQRLYIFSLKLSNENKQRLYKIQKCPTSLFYQVLLIKQNECIKPKATKGGGHKIVRMVRSRLWMSLFRDGRTGGGGRGKRGGRPSPSRFWQIS